MSRRGRRHTSRRLLKQSQAGRRAAIVAAITAFRDQHGTAARALSPTLRHDHDWESLVTRVEETLAEWPIPRLQKPYGPFLYGFDWPWEEVGGWSVRSYRSGSRAVRLFPGVGEALTALGPLLRPFIMRWWTDKAAQLNPEVEAARSVVEFEDFLFGRDRIALERVGEGLLDLQNGSCFYCNSRIGRNREIDHFVPWSFSGDDGLDNLVAACRHCNNSKRATLAGPEHLARLLARNAVWNEDLASLALERRWPRDRPRSQRITRAAYLRSPGERLLWMHADGDSLFETLGRHRQELVKSCDSCLAIPLRPGSRPAPCHRIPFSEKPCRRSAPGSRRAEPRPTTAA